MWSILLATVYLYSCSGTPANDKVDHIVKQFEKDTGVKVENTLIYFTKLEGKAVGRCFPAVKIIQLDLEFYNNASTISKKALVYHELGHCVCNIMKHAKEGTFCGDSLMTPTMQDDWCYRTKWNLYIKDLKERCK